MLDLVVVESKQKATHAVIWLHGLGADGHDFEAIVPELNLPVDANIRFIFPHAPVQPVTINMGREMRAWYDIKRIDDIKRDVDCKGIEDSLIVLDEIIKAQINDGVATENIIIAGFSQGGAIAALAGLTLSYAFAGIVLLSTYLPDWDYFKTKLNRANQQTPFFIGHGSHDPVVPFAAGQMLETKLEELGIKHEFHDYPMEHSVCMPEIHDISHFIQSCYGLINGTTK
ncbi:alpha/beta hydrolase [Cysteiniphilum halobium]|uniref:alpha/beta hydrolase n=1 Tax=Cysteiniphilum halobium TaxID=2219059 RepID=UPI000E6558A4|nr:dienelactone hydrolase family protein [Cysteiniphilum halobium]